MQLKSQDDDVTPGQMKIGEFYNVLIDAKKSFFHENLV